MTRGIGSALALVWIAGCYPDFQFTTSGSGGASSTGSSVAMSSTSGSHPGTSVGSTSASVSTSTTTTSSTGAGEPGPPCVSAGQTCTTSQSCCFDTVGVNDSCSGVGSCATDHLDLECTDDSMCSGLHCCTEYDFPATLRGTACHSVCDPFSLEFPACNPTAPTCNCVALLGAYFMGGMASPPYDQYGECN